MVPLLPAMAAYSSRPYLARKEPAG